MICSNRSALSAVTVKVLLRAGGVDDFIGKGTFLCTRREQLSLYLIESKYFSMYMFACMYWLVQCKQKPKGLCLQKTEYNYKLLSILFATSTPGATKIERPLHLFILNEASKFLPLPRLT